MKSTSMTRECEQKNQMSFGDLVFSSIPIHFRNFVKILKISLLKFLKF